MGVAQFLSSVRRILRNRYVDRPRAVGRHLGWQWRRGARAFPAELPLSESVLVASSGKCGVSALVNAHGMYDYNNMRLIKRALEDGGTFIDVGANIGAFSLIASEQRAARVLAFEPHPATFARMQENLRRNRRINVIPVCAAVGSRDGEIDISDTPGSATTHAVAGRDADADADASREPTIAVPLRRLDDELARHGLTADLLKIDVEGFEADVLEGCGAALAAVALVLVEINGLSDRRGAGSARVIELLHAAGAEGPYYYDAPAGCLRRHPVHAGEDPVFVNRARAARIPAIATLAVQN